MDFSSTEVVIPIPMKVIILTWRTNGVYEDGGRMVVGFIRYANFPQSLILSRDYFLARGWRTKFQVWVCPGNKSRDDLLFLVCLLGV